MAVARGAHVGIGLGLFTGVAMVTGLVCSKALLGSLSIRFAYIFFFYEKTHQK